MNLSAHRKKLFSQASVLVISIEPSVGECLKIICKFAEFGQTQIVLARGATVADILKDASQILGQYDTLIDLLILGYCVPLKVGLALAETMGKSQSRAMGLVLVTRQESHAAKKHWQLLRKDGLLMGQILDDPVPPSEILAACESTLGEVFAKRQQPSTSD